MLAIHRGTVDITAANLFVQAVTSSKHERYWLKNQYQDEIYSEQFFYHAALEDNGAS